MASIEVEFYLECSDCCESLESTEEGNKVSVECCWKCLQKKQDRIDELEDLVDELRDQIRELSSNP